MARNLSQFAFDLQADQLQLDSSKGLGNLWEANAYLVTLFELEQANAVPHLHPRTPVRVVHDSND